MDRIGPTLEAASDERLKHRRHSRSSHSNLVVWLAMIAVNKRLKAKALNRKRKQESVTRPAPPGTLPNQQTLILR